MSGPLDGVRVLELGSFIAGPFAGQLLGDYGADVVKVEAPAVGDPMRSWGVTTPDGDSLWWPTIARNKRSVIADLRADEGQAFVRSLAAEADIIIENFRPGRVDDFGLDYASVSAVNPGVIMVHVSGFGQTGPRAAEAGFGSVGEGMGGIRHTTGDPDRPSARCGISLGDSLAAMFAVIGAVSALVERNRSGKGQEVDVAIYEAVAALMESTMADHAVGGVTRERTGGTLKGVAPANAYPCADGSEVLIAGNADAVFVRLAAAMGMPELAEDPKYSTHHARGANMVELDEIVSGWTRRHDSDDVLAILADAGVPNGRVYTAADMLADAQYQARDMILTATARAGFDLPMTGIVPRFSRTPGGVRDVGPDLGEHTAAFESGWTDVDARGRLLSACEDLVPVLAEHATAADDARTLPREVFDAVVAAGILDAVVPTAFGGAGLGVDELCQATRILARGCPAQAWTISFLMLHAWLITRFPTVTPDATQGLWDDGVPRIAAPLAPSGTARPVEGGYTVSGRWEYATAVTNSNFVMVHAIVEGSADFATRFAVVPVDAVEILDDWDTSGMRATGSHTVVLDDVFVPAELTADRSAIQTGSSDCDGDGIGDIPLMGALALVASASAVGAAEGAAEAYTQRVRSRVLAYTLGDRAAEQPATQIRLATVAADLDGIVAAWEAAIARIPAGGGDMTEEERVRARLAAATAVRRSRELIGYIGEGAGASVYQRSRSIQRFQRDVETLKGHVVFDWDRTTELAGRILLGGNLGLTDMA